MSRPRTPAPSVGRAVSVMRMLGSHPDGLSLSQLARLTGGAKSSTLAVLDALVEGALVRHDEGGYRLGPATLELGGRLLSQIPEVRRFERECAHVPSLRDILVRLAMLDGSDIVYLARHEGLGPEGGARVGDRLPAASTAMGRALLAQFSDDAVRGRLESRAAFARLTAASTTDPEGLVAKLRSTRAAGFATEVGEVRPGVVGIGIGIPPSRPPRLRLAVGVSVAGTTADAVDERLVDALAELAARLAGLAGGRARERPERVQPAESQRAVA